MTFRSAAAPAGTNSANPSGASRSGTRSGGGDLVDPSVDEAGAEPRDPELVVAKRGAGDSEAGRAGDGLRGGDVLRERRRRVAALDHGDEPRGRGRHAHVVQGDRAA